MPKSNTKIGNTGLLFLVVGGTVIAGLIVYYSTGHSPFQDNALAGAFVAIIIGALLFFVTLPGFQSRIKNISVVMLVLLSLVSLGSMFFAGGVENAQGLDPSVSSQTITTDSTQRGQRADVEILGCCCRAVGCFPFWLAFASRASDGWSEGTAMTMMLPDAWVKEAVQ